ncbi:MAG TPA: hypothetical protein V6D12_22595 [Candidatus Obscuribacterales bacterium]
MNEQLDQQKIIKYQEELYELESTALAGSPITEAEQLAIIKSYLDDDFFNKLYAKLGVELPDPSVIHS